MNASPIRVDVSLGLGVTVDSKKPDDSDKPAGFFSALSNGRLAPTFAWFYAAAWQSPGLVVGSMDQQKLTFPI